MDRAPASTTAQPPAPPAPPGPPGRARSRPRRARSPRFTGLLIALAMALMGGGGVLLVALLNKSGPSKPAADARDLRGLDEPTDITNIGGTTDARIQVADKKNPGRIAAEYLFKQLNPVGGGTYDAVEPRAFLYMGDGRTMFVRADKARIRIPSPSDPPESGEFSGNGLVLVFPARAAGQPAQIDPEKDEPGLIAHFKAASFDTVLLEGSTREEVTIQTPDSSAVFSSALVRVNEVHKRLELARLGSGEFHHHVTDNAEGAPPARGKPVQSRPRPAPGAKPEPHEPAPVRAPADAAGAHASVEDQDLDGEAPEKAPSTVEAEAKEDLYRAVFTGGVTLTQATRRIGSDTLTLWARFLDNKLPEGALGLPDNNAKPTPAPAAAFPGRPEAILPALILAATPPAAANLPNSQRTLFIASPTDVVLTWQKELVATPLATTPPPKELAAGNHVHARFTSDAPGGDHAVRLSDSEIGAKGLCGIVDYAATTRRLDLASSSYVDRVDLIAPAAGRIVGPNLSINLASGVGQIRGGGTAISLQSDGPTVMPEADPESPLPEYAPRQVVWTDQADFKFFTEGEKVLDILEQSTFAGEVFARDQWSSLSGNYLKVDFDRIDRPNAKPRSSPKHLHVEGQALAVGAPSPKHSDPDRPLPPLDPFIAAQILDVDFAPATDHPTNADPTRLVARGTSGDGKEKGLVRVADRKSELTAMTLDAALQREPGGSRINIGDVTADGQVRLDRDDGVWATADKLVASGTDKWADLTSNDPTVPIALGLTENTVIRGPQAHLEDASGLLQVFGAGTFDHLQASDSAASADPALVALADPDVPAGMSHIHAAWSRSMSFTNSTGRIECHGDAEVSSRSAVDGQIARCERLFLNIAPDTSKQPRAEGSSAEQAPALATASPLLGDSALKGMESRPLLSAEMVGASAEREGGVPASVKSWKYGLTPAGERTFDQVMYLEAANLATDETTGLITIPVAGRGLVFDAGKQSATPGSSAAAPTVGPSGDTRFTWAKSLTFNRLSGELRMLENVELEHLALGSADKLTMRCPELTAHIDPQKNSGGKLLSATCGGPTGGAYAESGTQSLLADEFTYDGVADLIAAVSRTESPVTLNDTKRAAPILAKRLNWDRRTDRIEVLEPMPITAPMNK